MAAQITSQTEDIHTDTRRALTTKADHDGTRREPIPADALMARPKVTDCPRQAGRIL
jgi:hypothetical protein